MIERPSEVVYLSTLAFGEPFLDRLRQISPRLRVEQLSASNACAVPAEVWSQVVVLHTNYVLPSREEAPRLEWVQLDTSGADHFAGDPLWESGVTLTSIGGVSPIPMAEYAIMMILAIAHGLPEMGELQRKARWPSLEERWERFMPRRLVGATVVVVGYGRVGREVGRLARELGMRVVGVRRGKERTAELYDSGRAGGMEPAEEVVGPDRLGEVLHRADHVVVTIPRTYETVGLLGAAAFAALKPGAALVNISRGGIVDEEALLAALRDGRVRGAALDVFEEEPLPANHAFWRAPNVMVTPHVAGFAPDYEDQVLHIVTENLRRFLSGQPLLNRVDTELGY